MALATAEEHIKDLPRPFLRHGLGTLWRFGCYAVAMQVFFRFGEEAQKVVTKVSRTQQKSCFLHCFKVSLYYLSYMNENGRF